MKAANAAAVIVTACGIAAPVVAHAGHHCEEVSPVVGLERCRQFGWWRHLGSMSLEAGAVAMQFDSGPIDTDAYSPRADGTEATYHVVGAARRLTAAGVRVREVTSMGRHFYWGAEADMADLLDGPVLSVAQDASTRDAGSSASGTRADGSVGVGKLLIGEHAAAGPLTLGAELAPGLRIATYSLPSLPSTTGPAQAWFVLEAHVRAELWVTPQITIAGEAGIDLLRPGDVTAGIGIGIHMLPFDRGR